MGNCNSNEVTTPTPPLPTHQIQSPSQSQPRPQSQVKHKPQQAPQPQHLVSRSSPLRQIQVSSTIQTLVNHVLTNVLTNFSIGRELLQNLNNVCFSESQAKDLAKALIQGILQIEKPESSEQKEALNALFSNRNISMIVNDQLLYYGMLDTLKVSKVSESSKSRIYHTIANIKKAIKLQKKWQNQYKITCIKNNDYKKLSESQLQQIVQYETIADKTRQMGEKIAFKFQSIKKQSQKMGSLLVECMKKNIEAINQMKYDLSDKEVMKMAQISREACNYYENGIFILLIYFVQSCERLQKQSKSTQIIEELLKRAIVNIYRKYPPGQGLSNERQQIIKALRRLQSPKFYNKVDFRPQTFLLQPGNKQAQVEQIIYKQAKIAEEYKDLFEWLIKATCLPKCVYFKIGLKYYPSKPNIKSLTRIKEKMFFNKEQLIEKKVNGKDIKEVLENEQKEYRNIIDQLLQETDHIEFKITDMVRGKCIFLNVSDIIQSINQIKKFVAKNPRFGIKEIQNRFTNKIPISDVTLKIVINNKMVAQLQLTIQTNAATYNFAHKIYELQRSKVFSKLKIVHNYFSESRQDFSELAKKALELQTSKSLISQQARKSIGEYLKLSSNPKSFNKILQQVIHDNRENIKTLNICFDPLLQDLILISFSIAIGRWGKPIGRLINNALKRDNASPKLKSVILSIFFQTFQLPIESQSMQQLGILKQHLSQKVFIDEYIKEYFQIENALAYASQNQRLFHRVQQLRQIVFCKRSQYSPIELQDVIFVENLVIEEHSFQKIRKLRELFNFYFLARNKENNNTYPIFSAYSSWIENSLKTSKHSEAQIVKCQAQVIKAQQILQKNQPRQAQKILQSVIAIFKNREQHSKAMQCQILLGQCLIKTNFNFTVKKCIAQYEKTVLQKAQILGIQLKGSLYADSIWRIAEYLWDKTKSYEDEKQILRSFITRALEQMSRSKGVQFIYAVCKTWKLYDKFPVQKPVIHENPKVKYAQLQNIGAIGCLYLSMASWVNLTILNLNNNNNIGAAGCVDLSKGNWQNLTQLNLNNNSIGDGGCQFISKASWKKLRILHLNNNNIGDQGIKYISKAEWPILSKLCLFNNHIGALGCSYIGLANWKDLKELNLNSNKIGNQGCLYISMANWKNLNRLYLNCDNIGQQGRKYIRNADWWMSLRDYNLISLPYV